MEYIEQLNISKNNWIKLKAGENYTRFVQFLNYTDKELSEFVLERGETNYPWNQLEIDARIICQLYKLQIMVKHHIVTYNINIIVNNMGIETKTEKIVEESVYLLVNENGITKIDPKKYSHSDTRTIYLGVYDIVKNQHVENRSEKTTEKKHKSDKYYTTLLPANFLTTEMKKKLLPAQFQQCIVAIFELLDNVIKERIEDYKKTHNAILKLMPKFPKKDVTGKYIWFNYNDGNESEQEQLRLQAYLMDSIKLLKSYFFQNINNYKDILDYLEWCISDINSKIIKLDEEMYSYAQKVCDAADAYEANNKALTESGKNPRYTLVRSADLKSYYHASAYSLPETIFSVCRRVARDNAPLSELISRPLQMRKKDWEISLI